MPTAWRIPNLLTLLRVLLIPVLVLVFYLPGGYGRLASVGVFALAGLSDWLDGYLARRWRQTTAFGAFLDPVADKLIVAVALVLLVDAYATPWLTVPALVIVGREIVVSALREWMAKVSRHTGMDVNYMGKIKTATQMLAIMVLLFCEPALSPMVLFGHALLIVAAALTLYSMMLYLRAAWPTLMASLHDRQPPSAH